MNTAEFINLLKTSIQQDKNFSDEEMEQINEYFDADGEEEMKDKLARIFVNYSLDKPDLGEREKQQIIEQLDELGLK